MTRTTSILASAVMLLASGCGNGGRDLRAREVDCAISDPATSPYEFERISEFTSGDSGWYEYADPTKTALNVVIAKDLEERRKTDPAAPPLNATQRRDLAEDTEGGLAYQELATLEEPYVRCGNTSALHLKAQGYNFWGSGFATWQYEKPPGAGPGDAYEGLSFWARSAPNTDKTFMFYVDDGRTLVAKEAKAVAGIVVDNRCYIACELDAQPVELLGDGWGYVYANNDDMKRPCVERGGLVDTDVGCSAPQPASPADDLNGDGYLNVGETMTGTSCRIPADQKFCDPACYNIGAQQPSAAPCVPEADQCGNQFHTYVTTTDDWQFFRIPWSKLVQWPCPNRLSGGINPADIRKFEIKFRQGTTNEVWIDDLKFYRLRADAGS